MYREPGLEEMAETLSSILNPGNEAGKESKEEIDLFSTWDSWNTVRSVCNYSMRLFVGM
jgi:protein arginine N-methyltransferase 5